MFRNRLSAALLLVLLAVSLASAGTISIPFSFSPGTTIQSAQVNSNFSTIYNEFNGAITDANVSSLSESKTTFSGTGHDHSGGTKGALVALPTVHGRLAYVSTTSIKFSPYQGNRIYIKKSGVWTATTISSSGISAANTSVYVGGVAGQNLAATTFYYVYLFDNSGTTTVDFSTTTHATDSTTGMEIKSGDDTRVLIGMVRTNGSSQFADSATQRFVSSFFNRATRSLRNNFTADRTTASTTFVEMNSEIRCEFLTWADESQWVSVSGSAAHSNTYFTGVGFDGATKDISSGQASGGNQGSVGVSGEKTGLAEGYHYATVIGRSNNGANTLTMHSADATTTEQVRLHVLIRG